MTYPTEGVQLTFYCHARARHDGVLLYEWLLEHAKKHGIGGGSAFRAICGYGRHGVLHEEQFFELADDLAVKVEFLLDEAQARTLVDAVQACGVDAMYAIAPARFGVLGKADGPG
jgi:PII-like signaling protein